MSILFEHLFSDIVLERGYDYFLDGAISDLTRESNGIWATVQGTEDYSVFIELGEGGIVSVDCNCPHFQGGHNCKHLAAVFYALEENDAEPGMAGVRSNLGLALEILESLPIEEVLDFLGCELDRNGEIRTRFLNRYQGRGRLGESVYLRQINSIFRSYLGRSGFIGYDQVASFSSDVLDVMVSIRDLIEDEEYKTACTLTLHLIDGVTKVELDDSYGTKEQITENSSALLKRILDEGPNSVSDAVFAWLYPGLREGTLPDGSGILTDLLMTYFLEELQLHKKLAFIDEKLEPYEGKDSRFGMPTRIYWLGNKLKTLWALDDEERANQLINEHLNLPEIRLLVVEQYLRYGEHDKAIHLLIEGKELFKGQWGMAERYSRELMEIYHRRGDHHSLRMEQRLRVLEYVPGDLSAYLEYKQICPPKEWATERDYILGRLREQGVNLQRIYAEEGLWQDLLTALQVEFNHWDLDSYEERLGARFPEEIRDLLVRRVIELAKDARGRKYYARIEYELQKIAQYPGGPVIVEELKRNWASQYKNRWAMMDELGLA